MPRGRTFSSSLKSFIAFGIQAAIKRICQMTQSGFEVLSYCLIDSTLSVCNMGLAERFITVNRLKRALKSREVQSQNAKEALLVEAFFLEIPLLSTTYERLHLLGA